MRVLIIEDEAPLARSVARALREESSYAVDIALNGEDGLHLALTEPYDLVLLDLQLPKLDGLRVLREVRARGSRIPVLILTARDLKSDVVSGLDLGADDYLTKPFDILELLARCRALIRRGYDRPDPILRCGAIEIDTRARSVRVSGKRVELSAMEYRLLEYLALREGELVTREEIETRLYGQDALHDSNVVEVHISNLRKRLGPEVAHSALRTVRGQGYMLGGDAE
ncbi:MAG: response regulator transcription factor [Planctomycetes bacterium]|jgi:DNA-binding response OmpR family regulator|nr:response regulator transcription factor [Planctomycetota bacterium]